MDKFISIGLLFGLLTGCSTYSKVELDTKFAEQDKRIKEIATLTVSTDTSVKIIKQHLFPKAMEVSKANDNCAVDLKTNKCVSQ